MNSYNIFTEVENIINENYKSTNTQEFISSSSEQERLKCYYQAIIDYTNEKIFQTDDKESYVEDLGVMFDKLEKYLETERDKYDFFENYIGLGVSIAANVSGKMVIVKNVKPEEKIIYPRIIETPQVDTLEKTQQTSNKECALRLLKHVLRNKGKNIEYVKYK